METFASAAVVFLYVLGVRLSLLAIKEENMPYLAYATGLAIFATWGLVTLQ